MEEMHLGLNVSKIRGTASCKSRWHAGSSYHPPLLHSTSPSALVVGSSQSVPAHENSLPNLQDIDITLVV